MTTPLSQLQVTTRTIKRAQYEAFEFSLVPNGVCVRNTSHANPENHEYTVRVHDGLPTACTCPADTNYPSACKHRIAVAIRRPLLNALAQQQLLTDGGPQLSTPDEAQTVDESKPEEECDCADLSGDLPCWECFRKQRQAERD